MDELMPVWMAGTQRRSFAGDLLTETALRSVSALAGRVLQEAPEGPRDGAQDERTVAPRGALGLILGGERLDCLAEWLELCRGRRIHPALLPQALTLGKGARLLEAAGPRGLWLAAQNPDWRQHLGYSDGPEVWETGTARMRAEWLARQAPEQAAERLKAVWKQENAETRALLLASVISEEMLELGLRDRSKGVRSVAAQAMWRYPEAEFSQRMTALLAAGQPPSENPDFELGLPAGLGEKAGWLAQVAALAPLGPFVKPAGVWQQALLQGFTRATLLQGRRDWAAGLLRAGVVDPKLFLLLDWGERDAYLLGGGPRWDWYRLHRPFSGALAAKIWRELHILTQGRADWGAAQCLPELGHGFAVNLDLQQGWPEGSPHWRSWSSGVDKLLALHSFRAAMHKEMA